MEVDPVHENNFIEMEPPLSYGSLDIDLKPSFALDSNSVGNVKSFLTKNKPFPIRGERANFINIPHVVVMVGLPARGKTYMAKKLTRYLNWIGVKTRVFNVGEYRRRSTSLYTNHNFFRPDNAEAMCLRELCAMNALKDVCNWLNSGEGDVAVFDATNTTVERRRWIFNIVVRKLGFKLFYVESICNDQKIIESNIREVKLSSPDYVGVNPDEAIKDFIQRIEHYKDIYHPLDEEKEEHLSFMKIINTGEKVVVHKHEGHVQARIIYYLMNIRVMRRDIYLTSAGESQNDVLGKVGGNSSLSERGLDYAKALADYMKSQDIPRLRVWTSWMNRTVETAQFIERQKERWKCLDELDLVSYRFTRGESYEDLVARLEPVIMELERQENVLIIAHQAVLRCLLGYYLDVSSEKLPYIKVPPHTVLKLVPIAYGCEVEYIPLNVPAVDTYQERPSKYKSQTVEEPPAGVLDKESSSVESNHFQNGDTNANEETDK
ncbi:6-phosphofructo-2-kinase/fructose-2,6-bisphosphatase [Armadillidium nasatum]|uniref:6-phosphofructo-2-kinase/fructose-2, 6-bisphosphatase n=1 Tax=Armadillidium nasatum TaxID=96803 RepID=A0A5N5TI88_9CRUS|nr:6-phosphofructo-2-kinase/fructose-2,6-bisphosphatase [Armadillidium nasatum]